MRAGVSRRSDRGRRLRRSAAFFGRQRSRRARAPLSATDFPKDPGSHRGPLGGGGRQALEPIHDAVFGYFAPQGEIGDGSDQPLGPSLIGAADLGIEPNEDSHFLARIDAATQARPSAPR